MPFGFMLQKAFLHATGGANPKIIVQISRKILNRKTITTNQLQNILALFTGPRQYMKNVSVFLPEYFAFFILECQRSHHR